MTGGASVVNEGNKQDLGKDVDLNTSASYILPTPKEFKESLLDVMRNMGGQRGVRSHLDSFFIKLKEIGTNLSPDDGNEFAKIYEDYGWNYHASRIRDFGMGTALPTQSADQGSGPELEPDFHQQIDAYLRGTLPTELRPAFLSKLKQDQVFRLNVILARQGIEATAMPISEQAAILVSKAVAALSSGNSLFPGNPYIAGIENRPDIRGSREQSYLRTIELCNQLLDLGELEDLALENRYRAECNIPAGVKAQSYYGPSSRESSFFGAMAAVDGLKTKKDQAPHWYDPVNLLAKEVQPTNLATAMGSGKWAKVEIKSVLQSLPEQFPDLARRGYIWESSIVEDLPSPEVQSNLMKMMKSAPEVVEQFKTYLDSPITGAKPQREVAGRAVAAKLLIAHHLAEGDPEALTAVVDLTQNLLSRNSDQTITEHTATLLQTLLELTAHAANRHESVWDTLKPVLIDALENRNYGFDPKLRHFGEFGFIETLRHLEQRVGTDEDLHREVLTLAASKRAPVCYAALDAVCALPIAETVPILVGYVGKEHKDYQKEDIFTISNGPSALRQSAARRLGTLEPEKVGEIRFSGELFLKNYNGDLNTEEALELALRKDLADGEVGRGNADFEVKNPPAEQVAFKLSPRRA